MLRIMKRGIAINMLIHVIRDNWKIIFVNLKIMMLTSGNAANDLLENEERSNRGMRSGGGTRDCFVVVGCWGCAIAGRPEDASRDRDSSYRKRVIQTSEQGKSVGWYIQSGDPTSSQSLIHFAQSDIVRRRINSFKILRFPFVFWNASFLFVCLFFLSIYDNDE